MMNQQTDALNDVALALATAARAANELVAAVARMQSAARALTAPLARVGVNLGKSAAQFDAQLEALATVAAQGAHTFNAMAAQLGGKPSQAVQ